MSDLGFSLGEIWNSVRVCKELYKRNNFALNSRLGMEKLQLLLCKNASRTFLGLKPQQAYLHCNWSEVTVSIETARIQIQPNARVTVIELK